MSKTWVVTFETYLRQVKSWSFLFMILGPFLMIALTAGISYISANSNQSSSQVAVISNTKALRTSYLQQHSDNINTKITTVSTAKKAVKANHLAGYLTLSNDGARLRGDYHGSKSMSNGLQAQVKNFLTQYQQVKNYQTANLSPKQQKALAQTPVLKQHVATKAGTSNLVRLISFWVLVTMIYIILITYSSITSQEIASEKGTKIMEIIFSSTTATSYFVGKITGILLMIITQIVIYLLGGWAGYAIAMNYAGIHRLVVAHQALVSGVFHNLFNLNMLYLLFGVVIYTILAAYSGALVAKAEDASKAAQPVVMLGMLGFFATFPFQNNMDALAVKILSYVPFFSSYFMPMRIINGTAGWGEQWGSLAILIVATALFAIYIGRQYQRLMLQTDSQSLWQHLFEKFKH
ncbi:ABC transporter permease [Levilactobacillus yiduensis]|uniref:ABC transporter permease n=1 Tax=Levilactobacillus yiduensis TaxID=2953880 RepID=UPI000EF328E8|nr:ABC transporter permease [Levilactobacillus yiduensis]AYM02564.1 ABC transporter permease [Levilactobacillus brevis]